MLLKPLLLSALASFAHSSSLRGRETGETNESRRLAAYYSTSDATILGSANLDAAVGNPLKGLHTSPDWTGGNTVYTIPSTLEFHYVGMNEVMTGDNMFDWSKLDKTIKDAAYRSNHVIWRIYVDYPGRPLALPKYLIDAGVKLVPRGGKESSPQYDDLKLMAAFEQLIKAMGARYDGHKSIAFIQLGLLGKWGEWHTYPEEGLISGSTQDKVVEWYKTAFKTTKLQSRGITSTSIQSGMGLHDDSFAYSTLGSTSWFFWPRVVSRKATDFWKKAVMGGETRPELQNEIFDPAYKPGSDMYKQDFMQCVETTHATYMFTHAAFINGGMQGAKLVNAMKAHARLGYNFQVSNVAVSASTVSTVALEVTIKQVGVAPFYYPLNLALSCAGTKETVSGVETLIEFGSTKVFTFASIPADAACLSSVRISLESPFTYAAKPIKFAQGNGTVVVNLPIPNGSTPVAVTVVSPTRAPRQALTNAPTRAPTRAPARSSTPAPVKARTLAPVQAPTNAPAAPVTTATVTAPTGAPLAVSVAPPPSSTLFIEGTQRSSTRYVIAGSTSVSRNRRLQLDDVGGYKGSSFRHHRWSSGGSFMYTVAGFIPGATHTVTFGFAETYDGNCGTGKRLFNIVANDVDLMTNLDVFAAAGCKKGYTLTRLVTADDFGEIEIKFVQILQNPFVSFIHIVEN